MIKNIFFDLDGTLLPMEQEAFMKAYFTELGYADVLTYLNSGNVVFSACEQDESVLADAIRAMIRDRLGLDIPVFVIMQEQLETL